MRPLEFGWFLPTSGDTTAYNVPDATVRASPTMFERVIAAAEQAGFGYVLIPVAQSCWEAYVTGAWLAARSQSIKMLIAARPGYINPVLLAKMIATLDNLSGGRVSVNLIAGQFEAELEADGIRYAKEDRYALMDEEVSILKALWTANRPVDFAGRFYTLRQASIRPRIVQRPHPAFYLGGGSQQAAELSAKHSDVHLFWGDTPQRIAANIADIRALAAHHGREQQIGFGMRLQIVCREREQDAWDAAHTLVAQTSERDRERLIRQVETSEANRRVQALAREHGELIGPHLWTGITRVRPGAGIAVVGNPVQCADTLQEFIDVGCHSFCLSGYLHDEEAERFGRLVRPLLAERNADRMLAA